MIMINCNSNAQSFENATPQGSLIIALLYYFVHVIFLSVCGLVANIIVVLFRTCYFPQCVCGLVANTSVVLFHTCYFPQCVWVRS